MASKTKAAASRKQSRQGDLASMAGASQSPMPDFVQPELATFVKEAPTGPGWVYEVKLDGYRMLAKVGDGKAEMVSRSAKDWTGNFTGVAAALATLPIESAWLDGEVIVMASDGRTSFQGAPERTQH